MALLIFARPAVLNLFTDKGSTHISLPPTVLFSCTSLLEIGVGVGVGVGVGEEACPNKIFIVSSKDKFAPEVFDLSST